MTGTPDLFLFRAVLHDAVEVSTDGGKCFEFSRSGANQKTGLAAELKNLAGIWW